MFYYETKPLPLREASTYSTLLQNFVKSFFVPDQRTAYSVGITCLNCRFPTRMR
jgi:hypothetical protein